MIAATPEYVIHEAEGNPVGANRQWAWLMRVMRETEPTPTPTPTVPTGAREEQPTASRAG